MPFPMKIQPIDFHSQLDEPTRFEPVKPVVKSRFKRLFERQFTSVLKTSAAAEKAGSGGEEVSHFNKEANTYDSACEIFEPSSVCLAKMVQNFIEGGGGGGNDKQSSVAVRCGRNRCNCFNGICHDSSEDDLDLCGGFGHDPNFSNSGEGCEILKVN